MREELSLVGGPRQEADLVVDLSKENVRTAVHQIVLLLESQGLLDQL